jgi:hypothetical protein
MLIIRSVPKLIHFILNPHPRQKYLTRVMKPDPGTGYEYKSYPGTYGT